MVRMENGLTFKWLGIAGVELSAGGRTILIDPVFTRVPLRRVLAGRVAPDKAAVRGHAARCDDIFITHAHYDHLLDAPLVSARTGAAVHGSPNACALASACGAPGDRLDRLAPGSRVEAPPFSVTALAASHIRLPGFGRGRLPDPLAPPLRALQYRMDENYVFLVQAGGLRLLAGPGLCLSDPGEVDVLLCNPIYLENDLAGYVGRIRPRLFVPIHWEDMFLPADLRPKPGIVPRFPFRRIGMERVRRQVEALGVRYLLPERSREYPVEGILHRQC